MQLVENVKCLIRLGRLFENFANGRGRSELSHSTMVRAIRYRYDKLFKIYFFKVKLLLRRFRFEIFVAYGQTRNKNI